TKMLNSYYSQAVEGINKSVMRMVNIINHLKEFGRQEQGKDEVVDIHHVIENSFFLLEKQLSNRNIKVIKNYVTDILPVRMCPQNIEQVFINLLVNARDAVKDSTVKEIQISTTFDKDYVYVSVADTGTGIPDNIRDKIFQPFFTTKPQNEGTGLGLSIIHSILKDHQGEINIAPFQLGRGALFTIKLPLTTSSEEINYGPEKS
ncbi:MAG: HAMP domain-containing sensor histidine kinase, partial [Pseudomonadota bacterium]